MCLCRLPCDRFGVYHVGMHACFFTTSWTAFIPFKVGLSYKLFKYRVGIIMWNLHPLAKMDFDYCFTPDTKIISEIIKHDFIQEHVITNIKHGWTEPTIP